MGKKPLQVACATLLQLIFSFMGVSSRDYCIIGAGPAGLQMGYFLERSGHDYMIYERDSSAGWFYKVFPRHRTLISLNKRYTGKTNKEFNLRHDWNSLISDDPDLLMTKYSKEFFPKADTMVRYLKDFAKRWKLKAQYNTYIHKVTKNKNGSYTLKDQSGTKYHCKTIISSTGLWVENVPKQMVGVEHTVSYMNMSINRDDYEGKTVLVLGRGNSGFETAQHLLPSANLIHMMSRSRLKFSWETHYVGDVRAVNCGPIDTYQLKSLDGQLEGDLSHFSLTKHNGKLYITYGEEKNSTITPKALANRNGYDVVIRATGFKYDRSIFHRSIRPKPSQAHAKYPEIKPNYEFTSTPNIYVAGTAVHSLDFRKSAGGFIHGFRYTTRTLARYLEWKNHGTVWPHVTLHVTELMNYLIQRINEASDIYQMFSQLCDVIVFRDTETVEYYQAVGIGMLPKFKQHTGKDFMRGIVVNMEYGKNFSGPGSDPFREDRATGQAAKGHTSNFLHPVLYYYTKGIPALQQKGELARPQRVHHMVEDFLTDFVDRIKHTLPLRWFLEYCSGTDLRRYNAQSCMKYAMMGTNIPTFCQKGYLNGEAIMSS